MCFLAQNYKKEDWYWTHIYHWFSTRTGNQKKLRWQIFSSVLIRQDIFRHWLVRFTDDGRHRFFFFCSYVFTNDSVIEILLRITCQALSWEPGLFNIRNTSAESAVESRPVLCFTICVGPSLLHWFTRHTEWSRGEGRQVKWQDRYLSRGQLVACSFGGVACAPSPPMWQITQVRVQWRN